MSEWTDEVVKEIGMVIRSGWDMNENLAKIVQKVRAGGIRDVADASHQMAILYEGVNDKRAAQMFAQFAKRMFEQANTLGTLGETAEQIKAEKP